MYAHGHHRANGHVSGRVRDHGRLYVDGRDRGHHHGNGHVNGRRVRDRGRLRADGRDRVGAGADVHVHGCVRHHCNTASCFWQAATRQYPQSRPRKTDSATERYRLVQTPVLRA